MGAFTLCKAVQNNTVESVHIASTPLGNIGCMPPYISPKTLIFLVFNRRYASLTEVHNPLVHGSSMWDLKRVKAGHERTGEDIFDEQRSGRG